MKFSTKEEFSRFLRSISNAQKGSQINITFLVWSLFVLSVVSSNMLNLLFQKYAIVLIRVLFVS